MGRAADHFCTESRCDCGQLLGMLSADSIEIKCRRCRRLHIVKLSELSQFFKDKEPSSSDPSTSHLCSN